MCVCVWSDDSHTQVYLGPDESPFARQPSVPRSDDSHTQVYLGPMTHPLADSQVYLVVATLVHTLLDYCNVVFAALPACDIRRLQSVLNTAVRLVADSTRCDHAFSLLRDRHWLPVKQRVENRLCMTVHRCLYSDAPSHLLDLITPSADATVRPGLRSAASSTVAVPRTMSSLGDRSFAAAGPLAHGTDCHHRFVVFILLLLLNDN